jgi:hypothetical protein
MDQPNYIFPNKPLGNLKPDYPAIKKKPRAFKLFLSSTNRLSGSTLTSAVFNVNLPQNFHAKRLYLRPDTVVIAASPNAITNVTNYPTVVSIREFRNPDSWSSVNGLPHGVVCMTGGRAFANAGITIEQGATIVDSTLFDRPITIDVNSPLYDTTAANGVANEWVMLFTLYDTGSD